MDRNTCTFPELNLYNGEVIAFTIGDKQDTDFVLNTLDAANTAQELHVT